MSIFASSFSLKIKQNKIYIVQESKSFLNVLLIEDIQEKANALINALDTSIYCIKHVSNSGVSLLHQVEKLKPDLIIIDIESPNRDILDSLHLLSSSNPKPIVMFSPEKDTATINQLVKSGVSAYVAGGVDPQRVKSIIDTALARFQEYQSLKNELAMTKEKLSGQKTVEQAKLWLMEAKKLSEQEAYQCIRKTAMDNSQKMEDVAKNILSLAKMIGS